MQLIESIKMALYTIMSNKMRTALTILGIVIGIASVIAMVSIGQGNQKKMEKEFQKMGSNRASLYMAYDADYSESDLYNLEDVKAIRQKYGHLLKGISPNAQMATKYTSGKKELTVNLTGVNETYKRIESFDLVAGRFLTAGDMITGRRVVVLDVNMADKLLYQSTYQPY
jgi:putative ABC transport system permease protein